MRGLAKGRPTSGERVGACSVLLSLNNVRCLRTFLALGDFELNLITFLQALVAFGRDRAVVYKYVWPICATDEPVPLRVIEPLHYAFQPFH